jgi:acetoin utilization deacetylase AcuC-like enzyme
VATLAVYCSGETGEAHDTGPGHPERPARLAAVAEGLSRAAAVADIRLRPPRPATREELEQVHPGPHLDRLAGFVASGRRAIDADTRVSPASWAAAVLAAGAGLAAVEDLKRGEADAAFVAVRPPGHHATATAAMGFCLLNNVAVTAAELRRQGQRVLIVDWDVHHGNGTQDIFYDDPSVMYVSLHQWPLYPGTGRADETGGPAAPGTTVNVPLPPGATGDCARAALDEVVAGEVERFGPDWVLVSAGFDAHRLDPLAGLAWTSGDYADLAAMVAGWAPAPGRTVAFLEGGYDLDALADSVAATAATLAGAPLRPEPASSGGPGRDLVTAVAGWRRRHLG